MAREIGVHPVVIGAIQKGEIVDLEPRTADIVGCFPKPITVVLAKSSVVAVAAELRCRRVEARREESVSACLAVRALKVVRARAHRARDRRRGAADVGENELRSEGVGLARPRAPQVDAGRFGMGMQRVVEEWIG